MNSNVLQITRNFEAIESQQVYGGGFRCRGNNLTKTQYGKSYCRENESLCFQLKNIIFHEINAEDRETS